MIKSNNVDAAQMVLVFCIFIVCIMTVIMVIFGIYTAYKYDYKSNDFVYGQYGIENFDFYIINDNVGEIENFENKFETIIKYYAVLDNGNILLSGIKLDVDKKYNMKILNYKISNNISGFIIDAGEIYD